MYRLIAVLIPPLLLFVSPAYSSDLLEICCRNAAYPASCLSTLPSYAPPSPTPADLARAAVNVTLLRARKTRAFLAGLSSGTQRENGALADCVEQITDSVDELHDTLLELHNIGAAGEDLRTHLDNALTWTSAARTDEETCLDGFEGLRGEIKRAVERHIRILAQVTDNALFFIDTLDPSRNPRGCRAPSLP